MRVAKITIHNLLGIDHLELPPGQFTCVSGPNGAGKTSLLRIAALHLHPSRGRVRCLGEELGRCDLRALRVRSTPAPC